MSKNLRIVLVILVMALMPVLWQSCTGALTSEDIVTRAHWTMNAVGSYHMTSQYMASSNSQEFKTIYGDGFIDLQNIEVDFSVPDRYRIKIEEMENPPVSMIFIGDESFINTGSQYQDSDVGLSYASYAMVQSINREVFFNVLESITDIEELPDEDVDGYDCYHFRAAWDKEKVLNEYSDTLQQQRRDAELPELSEDDLAEMIESLSDLLEDVSIEFGFWIDKDAKYIRKMVINQEQSTETEEGIIEYVTVVNYKFSMINEPITVEPPLDEDGIIQAGWMKAD
jgi:outer membrane lipoprotein-sorting protein